MTRFASDQKISWFFAKALCKEVQLGVIYPTKPCLDLGESAAREIPAKPLKGGGERILGHARLSPQLADVRSHQVFDNGRHRTEFGA